MRRLVLAAVVALLLAVLGSAMQASAARTPGVLPPQSHPFGHTYGEWQARWNQWAYSLPIPENPGFDETGALCANGQSGHVWFTSFVTHPGTTTRACTIPSGTALVVLVAIVECSTVEPPPFFGGDEAELRACASSGFEAVFDGPMSLTLDGVPVRDLLGYRSITPLFDFTLPEDNLLGLPAGTTGSGVSDGVVVVLTPLKVGAHTIAIHIESSVVGTVDEIYNLTVVPRGRY
jgi:hypothetical protein